MLTCPEEEPRIFSDAGSSSPEVPRVMVPFIFFLFLLLSWVIAWDGEEKGWVRVSLPPLRMMTGPVQHFRTAILEAWHFHVFSKLFERKGFGCVEFADLKRLFTTT